MDFQRNRSLKHRGIVGLLKTDSFRCDDVQRLGAEDRAVRAEELHVRRAVAHRGEEAVCVHGAHRGVGGRPGDVLRQGSRAADVVHADGADLQRGVAREVGQIVLGLNERMVERVHRLGRGDDHQRGTDRALIAVGGTVHDADVILALFLRGEGGGAAAVEVHGLDAAGVDHDLGDLLGAAAAGEGRLAAVKHHQHDLAVGRDADAGARGAVFIVVGAGVDNRLAVLDQHDAGADGLLDLVAIGAPVLGGADHRGAVLPDGKEVAARAALLIDHALHHEQAARRTGGHVEEVGVHAHDRVVVGHVSVVAHGGGDLVGHAGHAPGAAVVFIVVGIDAQILAGDVHRGGIEHHLLLVDGRGRVPDVLLHAGRERACGLGKHGIEFVRREIRIRRRLRCRGRGRRRRRIRRLGRLRIVRADGALVTGQIRQIVREGIDAGRAQIGIGVAAETAGALERRDHVILGIGLEELCAHTVMRLGAARAVGHKVIRARRVRQVRGEPRLHQIAEPLRGILLHLVHEMVGVQVAVEIHRAEGVRAGIVHTEVGGADRGRRGLEIGQIDLAVGIFHQVAHVAGPAAHIRLHHGIGAVALVPGDVHRAEHVLEFQRLAVRNGDVLQIAQRGGRGAVGLVLLRHEGGEAGVLRSRYERPCRLGIFRDTGTYVVEYELGCVLLRVRSGIFVRIVLEHPKVCEKCGEVAGWLRDRIVLCKNRHTQQADHHAQRQQKRQRFGAEFPLHHVSESPF